MKTRLQIHIIIATLYLSLTGNALAAWSANFLPPTADNPTMVIDLPNDLDMSILTTLAIELDGIDITAYLSSEGNRDFSYVPVEALANGEHRLRLIIINQDGSIDEKAQWSFNVLNASTAGYGAVSDAQQVANAESWLRSASFAADTLTEFSYRFSQQNIDNAPDRLMASSSGNARAVLQGEKWTVDAQVNYLLQSDKDLTLTGNVIDIGDYTIAADYNGDEVKSGFTLGHHDVGLNSLLFSAFQRRGASARVDILDSKFTANIFSFRPDTQTGVDDFTGLADSNNRLEGGSVSIKPFSDDSDALKVTAMYYDGKGSTGGIGVSDELETGIITSETDIATGSGWGVLAEKNLFQNKLTLRGEFAHSFYDIDGDTGLAPEDSSNAISVTVDARPFDNPVFFDKVADIEIGAKYERIDSFFASFGNQGMAADRNAVTVYNTLSWGGLSNTLQLARENNNVDDLASFPTDRLRTIAWDTNYAFDPQSGVLGWLGTPSLNFSGSVARLDRDKTPTGYAGSDTDSTTKSLTFGAGSSYNSWYWAASHTYTEVYDHVGTASDTVNNLSNLGLSWTVSERLSVNSSLQYSTFEDKDNDATTTNTNVLLGIRSALVPDKLNFNLDYNLNLAGSDDDSPDRHTINGEIEWIIRQARNNHPGFTFAIRGSMETTNGNTITTTGTSSTSNETQHQVFAVLRISAPLSAGF